MTASRTDNGSRVSTATRALAKRGPSALAEQRVRVRVYPSPFNLAYQEHAIPAGASVAEILATIGLRRYRECATAVWLNDRRLPQEYYHTVRPKAFTALVVRVVPQGRGIVRTVLIGLAVVAAAVVGQVYLGPLIAASFGLAAGSAGALAIGAASGAVLSLGVALGLNALIPLRPPVLSLASQLGSLGFSGGLTTGGGSVAQSPTYNLADARNQAQPWGPVTVHFGQHRFTPPYAAMPYTEIVGNEQYLRVLFCIGIGPLGCDDMRIGDTPLGQFQEVEFDGTAGTPGNPPLRLYPGTVFETSLQVALTDAVGFQQRTIEGTSNEISVDINFPNGLGEFNQQTGGLGTRQVELVAEYRPSPDGPWANLVNHIESQSFNFPVMPSDPGFVWEQQFRIGLNAEGRLELAVGNLIILGTGVPSLVPPLRDTVAPLWAFVVRANEVVNITDERGTIGFDILSIVGLTVTLGAGTYVPPDPRYTLTFIANQTSSIRRTISRVVPPNVYDVRIRRITPDTDVTTIIDKAFWTAVRGFSWANPINFPFPLCLIALRIRASGQLNGVLDTFNLRVTVGPAPYPMLWPPRNPATAYLSTLQGPGNARPVPMSRIDLDSLWQWAIYCNNKGFTFDMPRDFRASVWDTLLDICAAGRATLRKTTEGKWGVSVDELGLNTPPVQHFTPRNSWEFSAEKVYRELPHAWRARFLNEQEDYRQDERYVFRDGYSEANATLYEQLELPGVTNPDLVWRHGRMHFAQAQLRPEEYSFHCDWENLACQRGDRIRVTHDVPLWGQASGRITRVQVIDGVFHIGLDETVAMVAGKHYVMRFRRQSGVSHVINAATIVGETQTILVTSGDSIPDVGDLFQFGEVGQESVRLVVKKIEPGPDYTARLTCVDEAPAIHTADIGPIPAWNPHITQPIDFRQLPPPPPKFVSIDSETLGTYILHANGSVSRSIQIAITLDAPPDVGPGLNHYEGLVQLGAQIHNVVVSQEGLGVVTPVQTGEVYRFGARSVSVYGVPSAWVYADHTVLAPTLTPGPVLNLRVYTENQTAYVSYDRPGEGNFALAYAEIRVSQTADFIDGVTYNLGYTLQASAGPFTPGTIVWVWVRAVNIFDNAGPWTPSELGPGVPTVIAGTTTNQIKNGHFEQGDVNWELLGQWTVVFDPANAHDGSYYAAQIAPGVSPAHTQPILLVGARWVGLFGWFAASATADGRMVAAVQFLGADLLPITGQAVFFGNEVAAVPPDQDGLVWQESTLLMEVPPGAFYYQPGFQFSVPNTTGQWFADTIYADSGGKADILLRRYGNISTTNDLVNGTFELGDVLWSKETGWLVTGEFLGHMHSGNWLAAHIPVAGEPSGQVRRLTSEDFVEVFAGQSLTVTLWGKTINTPNGSLRIGLSWYNSQLELLGEIFSQRFEGLFPTYQQAGGSVRVPFNTAYCKVFVETLDHTSGGYWVIDDVFMSVAENDQPQLPGVGVQFPGQVQTGTYLAESLIAVSVLLETEHEVEYVQPVGVIWLQLRSMTATVIFARRQHAAGVVVGTAIATNLTNGTITIPVSLTGADDSPAWDSPYVLTAFGIETGPNNSPITIVPNSVYAITHVPTGPTHGAQVFSTTVPSTTTIVETVIATSPTINPAVQAGIMQPQGVIPATISADSAALVRIRQTNISGRVVGSCLVVNPLPSAVTVRMDAFGYDDAPVWDGVYVMTVQSIDATGTPSFVSVPDDGVFRMVHRRTGLPPARMDVYPGVVNAGVYTGERVIATSVPINVGFQVGYVEAAGVIEITIQSMSTTLVQVRQRNLMGKIIGSVPISNHASVGLVVPITLHGYDPEPRWGDVYVVTIQSAAVDYTPLSVTVSSGGTFAMLHTREQ